MKVKTVISILVAVGTAAAAIFAVLFVLPGLALGLMLIVGSQRTVFERAPSPSGWNEARVQFDDAGAINSFDRLVFIKAGWNPSDSPLLSCRAFWAEGENKIHLRWINNHTLVIQHAFPAQAIEAMARRCGSIQIVIRSIP